MRYGLHLLPDALLLIALLRMTGVHLHSERREMFGFLSAWLAYSLFLLFVGQVREQNSHAYFLVFIVVTAFVWTTALPALWRPSVAVIYSPWRAGLACISLVAAALLLDIVMRHATDIRVAELLGFNCWIAAVTGAIFLLASIGAEDPDRILWRGAGAFFLVYGFGYLLVGVARGGAWAYTALVLAASCCWFAFAWFIGPHPEHVFNLEKLALAPAAFRFIPRLARSSFWPAYRGRGLRG